MPDFTNAFLTGLTAGREIRKQRTTERALGKYAAGDTQGGVTELMSVDPDAAFSLQERATRQNVGAAMAAGDTKGAISAAYSGGDIQTGQGLTQNMMQLSAQQRLIAKDHASTIASIGIKLREQDPTTWGQTLDSLTPSLIDRGFDAAEIAKAKAAITSGGVNALDGLIGQSLDLKDMLDHQDKQAALAESTRHNQASETIDSNKVMTVDNGNGGQDVVRVRTGLPGASGGGNAFGAPVASVPASGGDRAGRNNNPGNLKDDGKSKWQGMTGVDSGGFVQFDTPENGARAAGINLRNQASQHGLNTLSGIISKYAPASDRNDTAGYIHSVAQQTGLDPNAPLNLNDPATVQKITHAMFAVESGGTPARVPAAPAQTGNAFGKPVNPGQQSGVEVVYHPEGGGLTPEAVTGLANQYKNGRDLPAGLGRNGVQTSKIVNAAFSNNDGTVDPGGAKANFQADKKNLAKVEADNTAAARAYGRAQAQLQIVKDLLAKGAGPGVPLTNVAIQQARRALGANDVHLLDQALGTFTDDYGTVMGGGSAGGLTDQKQREGNSRVDKYQNQGGLAAELDQMSQEMGRAQQVNDDLYHQARAKVSLNGDGKGAPSKALDAPKAANPAITPQQHHAAAVHYVPGAASGTAGNPWTPTNDAEFKYIKAGQYYVDTDGALVQK